MLYYLQQLTMTVYSQAIEKNSSNYWPLRCCPHSRFRLNLMSGDYLGKNSQ